MSSPWPTPDVAAAPRSGERSVWAWSAFGAGTLGGMLVAGLTLALWFVWDVGCTLATTVLTSDGCGDAWSIAWFWTLVVIAVAALALPTVGIVLAESSRRVLPYVLMLGPTPVWILVFEIVA